MSKKKKNVRKEAEEMAPTPSQMLKIIENTYNAYGEKFCSKMATIGLNGQEAALFENSNFKAIKSPDYNSVFSKRDGVFHRWGKTEANDPVVAVASEIADIEIVSGGSCLGHCIFAISVIT